MRKRVFALVKYDRKGASSRVRFWNLAPRLIEQGWEVEIFPLLSNEILERYYRMGHHSYARIAGCYLKRLLFIIRKSEPDIWWVEKELMHGMPRWIEQILAPFISRAIVDYDDAIFLNYSDGWLGPFGRENKFRFYARQAAHVTVGSNYLREQMIQWGCTRITSIPSTVSVLEYPAHKHAHQGVVIIGWIGTPVTVAFLETLKNVFPVLASRVACRLHIVGAQWECPGLEVICLPWSEANQAEVVSSFDIGIMPLVDGEWERAKCGYKLIQYMAAGVVPVGARVGENKIIIQEGHNGYLASEPQEWLQKLEMLCRNAQLRSEIGARARDTALRKYDVQVAAAAVHEVFTKVLTNQARVNSK